MPTKHMLIDASHPEETRVVVLDGPRLKEYEVEVASRKQLKGNIYLAKVTRVEPSLQAAFVDYGGNRHGFLAFNEIHPDYYQIPVADREALLAEQADAARAAEADDGDFGDDANADDEEEAERPRVRSATRHYKIQEVIKRRQIMLVQVVKEERGNKGAALTTYLSLAGRYCVLMPNSARGGGISRKITLATDRKRLKKVLSEMAVTEGMAVIVRTAGSGRSKAEIKRDYEYLVRLWTTIREVTLVSTAPKLVYEEANLIKRSLRDLYDREIEEIVVQGEPEYRTAKEFMKLFIPSHAKRVRLYDDGEKPLFHAFKVEEQLDAMLGMTVQLKSGGYIVINPTEALVAIDVNSGRATRERHIEETALRTNLEAADEVARQLRLRDLAGLIVIDFIDMENARNQAQVERRVKEAMKTDRARVQLGRISAFGLLELSRQRLRPSLLETRFEVCAYCAGVGLRQTTESATLAVLRRIEDEGIRSGSAEITATVPTAVALYLLNHKRAMLSVIEARYDMKVVIASDDRLSGPELRIERSRAVEAGAAEQAAGTSEAVAETTGEATGAVDAVAAESETDEGAKKARRRRPRRRRRSDEEREAGVEAADGTEADDIEIADAVDAGDDLAASADAAAADDDDDEDDADDEALDEGTMAADDDAAPKRRRRGRRGGRRRSRRPGTENASENASEQVSDQAADADDQDLPLSEAVPEMDLPADDDELSEAEPLAAAEDANESAPAPRSSRARSRRGGRGRRSTAAGEAAAGLEPQLELEPGTEAATAAGADIGSGTDADRDIGAEALPLHGEPMDGTRDAETPSHGADDTQPDQMAFGEQVPAEVDAAERTDEPVSEDAAPGDGTPEQVAADEPAPDGADADDGIAPSDEEPVPEPDHAHDDEWPGADVAARGGSDHADDEHRDEHRGDHPGETAGRPENGAMAGGIGDGADTGQKPPAGVVYVGSEGEPSPLPRRGWWQRLIDS
jgi:ribonuclease E